MSTPDIMTSEYRAWLNSLGKIRRDLACDRGLPFTHSIRYPGNVTSWALSGAVKAEPNVTAELATFTIGTPSYDAGTDLTTWVATLSASTTLGLPTAVGSGGVAAFVFDFIIAESGGVNPRRLFGGLFACKGYVTELA